MPRIERAVSYEDKDYTLATITNKVARQYQPTTKADGTRYAPREVNERLIVASLVAGGSSVDEAQEVVDSIPVFLDDAWAMFLDAMLTVNGLKVVKAGEEQAEVSPAK